jgi:hypothetical protein
MHVQSFIIIESYPGRSDSMTLIIGDDFYTTAALHARTKKKRGRLKKEEKKT